ncbi:MAG: chorismate mutase [Pseudomonadota bacterium]
MSDQDLQKLAELRAKIDMADQSIHALLMQRAEVIDELIKAKGASSTKGAAFRPGREAQMIDVLKARHSGSIPFSMITHLWREIISTFTWLQAPFSVHLPKTADTRLQDTVRYQFGFTVSVFTHDDVTDAMNGAIAAENAILVVETPSPSSAAWWTGLNAQNNLSVMARLPVVPVPFEAVDALALAPTLSDPVPFDWRVYVATAASEKAFDNWTSGQVLATQSKPDGKVAALIAIGPGGKAPADLLDIRAAGGYFAPLEDRETSI